MYSQTRARTGAVCKRKSYDYIQGYRWDDSTFYLSMRRLGGGEADGLGMAGEVGAVWLQRVGMYYKNAQEEYERGGQGNIDVTYHKTSRYQSVQRCQASPNL